MANQRGQSWDGLPTIHYPSDLKEARTRYTTCLQFGGHYHLDFHFDAEATLVQHITRTFWEADVLEPFPRKVELTNVAKHYGLTPYTMRGLYRTWVMEGKPDAPFYADGCPVSYRTDGRDA
jgi:hypothetical protein